MNSYFSELVKQSVSRATESTLSILGISDPALRTHLSQQMKSDCGSSEAFLAPPLFEHMFGWEKDLDKTIWQKRFKNKISYISIIKDYI